MTFEDESFDFIISRNVTWTVPEPEKIYGEWYRLLAPGGVVVNIAAEVRPQWDLDLMLRLGFSEVSATPNVMVKIFPEMAKIEWPRNENNPFTADKDAPDTRIFM